MPKAQAKAAPPRVAKGSAAKVSKVSIVRPSKSGKAQASAKTIAKPGKIADKKTARASQSVSRVTKVQRNHPVDRLSRAKHAQTRVLLVSRKVPQRLARAQIVSDDPWQRAVQLDRAKMERWENVEAREPRIVLPNLFGDDGDEKGANVLNVATGLLGRPYRFGARGYAFDCSGFVAEVFEQVGVELPHSARDQFGIGDRVPRDDLEPGDLVFFHTYTRGPSHVGIYMGGDKFIHSASGIGVKISSLNEDYYSAHYLGARRMEM